MMVGNGDDDSRECTRWWFGSSRRVPGRLARVQGGKSDGGYPSELNAIHFLNDIQGVNAIHRLIMHIMSTSSEPTLFVVDSFT